MSLSLSLSFNPFFFFLSFCWPLNRTPFSSCFFFSFSFFLYVKHLRCWVQVVCTCQRHLQPLSSFDYNTPTNLFYFFFPPFYSPINTKTHVERTRTVYMCLCIYLFYKIYNIKSILFSDGRMGLNVFLFKCINCICCVLHTIAIRYGYAINWLSSIHPSCGVLDDIGIRHLLRESLFRYRRDGLV